jgi:hypothetical protein
MEDIIHIQKKYTNFKDFVILKKIDWNYLSANPNAIHLLEQINWEELSINPNAIHLLSQNINKINWAIFK